MKRTVSIAVLIAFALTPAVEPAVSAGAASPQITLEASLEPSTVGPGGTFDYALTIRGLTMQTMNTQQIFPNLRLPNFAQQGMRVRPSFRQQVSGLGGMAAALTYTCTVRAPSTEGKYRIEPARYGAIQSNPVELVVTRKPLGDSIPDKLDPAECHSVRTSDPQLNRQLQGKLFLRMAIDKTSVYPGEPITVHYDLFKAVDDFPRTVQIESYYPPSNPNLYPDFQVKNLYRADRIWFQNHQIGNTAYLIARLQSDVIYPIKSGPKKIGEFTMGVGFADPDSRRPRSLLDDMFNDPFPWSSLDTIRGRMTVPATSVEVTPLPAEGRPSDFSGVVGNFDLQASFDYPKVRQYEPVTLKVRISGEGLIESVSPPKIPETPGLLLSEEKTDVAPGPIPQSKTFEYVYRATTAGPIRFPGIDYVVFDPETERYERLQTDPQTLQVAATSESDSPRVMVFEAPSGNDQALVSEINENIEYIQTRGFLRRGLTAQPLYQTPGFLLFQLVPAGIVAAGLVIRRRRERYSSDVALARRRSARSVAARHLRGARRRLADVYPAEFYEELEKALRWYAADQINVAPAGLTTEQIAEALAERNVEPADISEMTELLEMCESVRYAARESDEDDMHNALLRASQLIDRLAMQLK